MGSRRRKAGHGISEHERLSPSYTCAGHNHPETGVRQQIAQYHAFQVGQIDVPISLPPRRKSKPGKAAATIWTLGSSSIRQQEFEKRLRLVQDLPAVAEAGDNHHLRPTPQPALYRLASSVELADIGTSSSLSPWM